MRKLSSKRQVTLPRVVCDVIGVQPGDFIDVFARDGVVHVVPMNSNRTIAKSANPTRYEDSLTSDDIDTRA